MSPKHIFRLSATAVVISIAVHGQTGIPTVRVIQDVKIGMARPAVLSALGKQYELTKIGSDEPQGSEWLVSGKDPAKFELAKIGFVNDKVWSVSTYMYPPMGGEAVKLMERLFFLFQDRAEIDPLSRKLLQDPKAPTSVIAQLGAQRHLNLPLDLYYKRNGKLESMEIEFSIGKEHFSIEVSKVEGFPDRVEVQKYVDTYTEMKDK